MLNKKGIGFDDIVETLIMVFFILLIVFLFANHQIRKESTKFCEINKIKMSIEADELLLNYLQKNITFDINKDSAKEKITIQDLIMQSYLNNDKDAHKELKKITEEFLQGAKRNAASGWSILIFLMPDKQELLSIDTYDVLFVGENIASQSSTIIPLTISDKYILVGLYEKWQGIIC